MAEMVEFMSGVAGLFTLADQVVKLSYNYLSDNRDAKRTRGRYLTELSALKDALDHAQEATLDAERLGVVSPRPALLSSEVLDNCHKHLQLLRKNLEGSGATEERGSARLKSALVWSFEEPQMKKEIETLHHFRNIFSEYVSASILAVSRASYEKLDLLTRERERSQLLEWLQPPDSPRHAPPIPSACTGTGKWFLESDAYLRWRSSEPSILWCRGKPGVGKSILSSIVLQDLSSSTTLHYFCDFAAGKHQTSTLVLQSLMRQMLMDGNDDHVAILKQCRERSGMPPRFKDLMSSFIEMCKLQRGGIYVVLDALDELEDRSILLPILSDLVHAGCYVFATSRPIPDIEHVLASAAHHVELEASRDDLKLFVESELRASDLAHIAGASSIVDAVIDRAGGIFLLARLLMSHLMALTTMEQIRESLAGLPSDLTSAYQSSLDRILAQPPARSALALRVIAWIVHAERRLRTSELLQAFAVDHDGNEVDEQNITSLSMLLQVCVGLVVVNDDTTIGLVHATAHSFFEDKLQPFLNAHEDMANTCLRFLCLQNPFGHGPCDTLTELDARICDMPFLAYAAYHWGQHARRVEQPLIPLIRKLLDDNSLRASSFQVLQHRKRPDPQLAEASFAALPTGVAPLHVAAYWNLKETAELYMDGDSISQADAQGWTPLHWACSKGSAAVRELLLRDGAAVNVQDSRGWTPLFWASFSGDCEALTRLLACGADHLIKDISSWTALQWAVFCGKRDVVEALLIHHKRFLVEDVKKPPAPVASLGVADARQAQSLNVASMVPAEIAAETGNASLLDLLLEAVSSGSAANSGFNEAWKRGRFDPTMPNIWRMMTKSESYHGQEVYIPDVTSSKSGDPDVREWRSRLMHAAIRDNKLLIVQLLLELGADANYTLSGRTTLYTAAFRRNPRFVETLLAAGADPNLYDDYGHTALHQAILNGSEETAAALITGGADVNARVAATEDGRQRRSYSSRKTDLDGATSLIFACGFRITPSQSAFSTRLVQVLLAAGADITALDCTGRSAIHYAIQACDLTLVTMLLEQGAKIPPSDPDGGCAIHTLVEGRSHGQNLDDLQSLLDLLLENLPPGAHSMERHNVKGRRNTEPNGEIDCPLSLALKHGKWDLFTMLLERGALLRTNKPLEPFLRAAVRDMNAPVVQFLLDEGAKPGGDDGAPNIEDLLWRSDPLYYATVWDSFTRILGDLINAGIDIDFAPRYAMQPALLVAAKTLNLPDVVQALLDAGANLYLTNVDGLDAFLLSMLRGNFDVLRCLLQNTSKFPHPNAAHWTQPLDSADLDPSRDAVAYICACLKQHGMLKQRTKSSNKTLLQIAVEAGNARAVSNLIACGADANEANAKGWRPLHTAIFDGHGAVIDALLAADVDIHAATEQWEDSHHKPSGIYLGELWAGQPLHLACMTGNARIVAELLARGADVHASTGRDQYPGHGPTALHITLDTGTFYGQAGHSLDRGRLEIAKMLVERGAEVRGVVDHLRPDHVLRFEGFEDVWDKLRLGVSEKAN
ncbi:ankyrin repeat-containing domain protein [Mycena belliarum]|uniref:Ankyrin repeat-containing domain protein n=1 Tax=Mycena belliarum TaxID=1033014 RepID=A0AAD6TTB2_9AGAR|nr:ankyrin repeat-containing domain protein [Mycena belliae]